MKVNVDTPRKSFILTCTLSFNEIYLPVSFVMTPCFHPTSPTNDDGDKLVLERIPLVSASVSVFRDSLYALYILNQMVEFHQTFMDISLLQDKPRLIRFGDLNPIFKVKGGLCVSTFSSATV